MTPENPVLPLRERKKLRTRQALIDTALELFGERGFDRVTLDQLCEAVEVSKRTFFRAFSSKEDVAAAPTQDLWTAFLEVLEDHPPQGRPLVSLYEEVLVEAIALMPREIWAQRVLASRRLAADTPSMDAHGLAFCNRVSEEAAAVTARRFALDPARKDAVEKEPVKRGAAGEGTAEEGVAALRIRLALDMLVSAFHQALAAWVAQPAGHTREDLTRRLRATCAELPGALAVTAEPRVEDAAR
ncbi:TetR/AcrR family transcriptional regulator [Kitasatospora sp. NPDC059648]|uniref:TetR/AcrR family transcriptional regulator n=1 Tax=Kitasatospora sp. NPDC059648 TaxID=3346894 RepID=UPI0036B45C92